MPSAAVTPVRYVTRGHVLPASTSPHASAVAAVMGIDVAVAAAAVPASSAIIPHLPPIAGILATCLTGLWGAPTPPAAPSQSSAANVRRRRA